MGGSPFITKQVTPARSPACSFSSKWKGCNTGATATQAAHPVNPTPTPTAQEHTRPGDAHPLNPKNHPHAHAHPNTPIEPQKPPTRPPTPKSQPNKLHNLINPFPFSLKNLITPLSISNPTPTPCPAHQPPSPTHNTDGELLGVLPPCPVGGGAGVLALISVSSYLFHHQSTVGVDALPMTCWQPHAVCI